MARKINWLENIKYTGELDNLVLRCFLYGKPGTGKTTFAGSAPNPFFLCAEDGMLTLFKNKGIPHYVLDEDEDENIYETVREILHSAKNKVGAFGKGGIFENVETFIIDSISELNAILKRQILKNNRKEKADFDDWGQLKNQISTIANIHKRLPMNSIAIAGESARENKVTEEIEPTTNIEGSFRDDVMHLYDFNFWMHKKERGNSVKYLIATEDNRGHDAKARGIILPKVMEDADFNLLRSKFEEYTT